LLHTFCTHLFILEVIYFSIGIGAWYTLVKIQFLSVILFF